MGSTSDNKDPYVCTTENNLWYAANDMNELKVTMTGVPLVK
jgi:hypothetical protein